MKIGTMVHLDETTPIHIEKVKQYGLESCQLVCWDMTKFTDEKAASVVAASREYGIEISALWCGWEGEAVWNFIDGYHTLGLVPLRTRKKRIENLFLVLQDMYPGVWDGHGFAIITLLSSLTNDKLKCTPQKSFITKQYLLVSISFPSIYM